MTAGNMRQAGRSLRAGLAGWPIAHSLSPRLYAAAADNAGLDCSYELLPCQPDDFAKLVGQCRQQGYHGINVTTPHKQTAFELADSHSSDAELTGNANLLIFGDDGISAANTDVAGFSEALVRFAGCDVRSQRAVLLGCGSVAASVLLALARQGCSELTVGGRSTKGLRRFEVVAERCSGRMEVNLLDIDSDELDHAIARAELIVNCTSAGMPGKEEESALGGIFACRPGLLAMDLVYHPPVTRFLSQMTNCGAQTVNGLSMLACQASASFELLTELSVDSAVLLSALEDN